MMELYIAEMRKKLGNVQCQRKEFPCELVDMYRSLEFMMCVSLADISRFWWKFNL